jgi:hypothetical protein
MLDLPPIVLWELENEQKDAAHFHTNKSFTLSNPVVKPAPNNSCCLVLRLTHPMDAPDLKHSK